MKLIYIDQRYTRIESGSCKEHGFSIISTKEECEAAAIYLNLVDHTAYSTKLSSTPYGCIYASNDWLGWHVAGNPRAESVACGSKDSSNRDYYYCICKLSGIKCL